MLVFTTSSLEMKMMSLCSMLRITQVDDWDCRHRFVDFVYLGIKLSMLLLRINIDINSYIYTHIYSYTQLVACNFLGPLSGLFMVIKLHAV